jgi:hypothetical protein
MIALQKYYSKEKITQNDDKKLRKAYQIKESFTEENITKLIEGTMSTKKVIDLSHKYNTTVTIFLTSLLIYSIIEDMPHKSKNLPVVISVPINLRQYFKSYTAR